MRRRSRRSAANQRSPPGGTGQKGEMGPGRPRANHASARLKPGLLISATSRGYVKQGTMHACSCAARHRQSCAHTEEFAELELSLAGSVHLELASRNFPGNHLPTTN